MITKFDKKNKSNASNDSTSSEIFVDDQIANNLKKNEENNIEYDDIVTVDEFKAKELLHYKMLEKFFLKCSEEEIVVMVNIINGNHVVSLRFLDWFVTRYCFLYKLTINVANNYTVENNYNINISYKAQLKSFKKKYFDPFRRKKKFYYNYTMSPSSGKNNILILTTIGQLNFFRWIITHDIIKYAEENYKNIISKINHVNSYFKKNIIENISLSISDEINDSSKSAESTKSTESNEDINLNSQTKNEKIIKKNYKSPQISRNIFVEL
jgi:hypothetical protein